jgi:ribose transport system permease protein
MTLAMMQIGAGICALLVRGQIAYAVPDLVSFLRLRAGWPGRAVPRARGRGFPAGWPPGADLHALRPLRVHGRGNREAAEYAGVNVKLVLGAVIVISAMCSGVAGMLGVAHFGSAQQNEFDGYLLDAIAAVVVGGTSLFGGRGGIGNTIIGLLILAC